MSDFYNDRFHIAGHGDYLQIGARQVENPNSDSFEFRKGIQGAFQKKKKRSTLTGGGYLSCDILRRDKLLAVRY